MRVRSPVAVLVSILIASFGALPSAHAAPGDLIWEHRDDVASIPLAIFTAFDGGTVYMVDEGFSIHAFAAPTGQLRWRGSWGPPPAAAHASAMSPDGSALFLVGERNVFKNPGYATVAFDTTTGERMWVGLLESGSDNWATSVAVSPGGDVVFVTGASGKVVAYRAATGKRMWVTEPARPVYGEDLAVSPDGTRLYVVGDRGGRRAVAMTIAYSTRTGRALWRRRFSYGDKWSQYVRHVAVTPSEVLVTGSTYPVRGADNSRSFTLAYDAASGRSIWTRLYNGSPSSDYPQDLVIDPATESVFVTGTSDISGWDIHTVAYDVTTGDTRWVARYEGEGLFDEPNDITVDPTTGIVYVLATVYGDGITELDDFGLVAYDATNGELKWDARYGAPGELREQADALVLSPNRQVLYVTGSSADGEGSYDSVVLAYATT
jgi:outer membrane protein assembly factor BamB